MWPKLKVMLVKALRTSAGILLTVSKFTTTDLDDQAAKILDEWADMIEKAGSADEAGAKIGESLKQAEQSMAPPAGKAKP